MPLVRPVMPAAPVEAPVERPPVSLPDIDELREMIASLLDRKITVTREYSGVTYPDHGELALFDDDEGILSAIAICDVAFAAGSAAALALVPLDKVEAAIESQEIDDLLRDNYYEVINILSSLLNGNPDRHVRLTTTHRLGDDAPIVVDEWTSETVRSFNVEIDGYASGSIHFCTR